MKQKKRKIISRSLVCLSANLLFGSLASGQILTPKLPENNWLVLTEEQFQQGHYNAASQSAGNYLKQQATNIYSRQTDAVEKATYYLRVSDLKLDRNGAVDSAIRFIGTTNNPAYKQRMAYAMAQYYFQAGAYTEAIPYYEAAGISNLSNAEIANAKFELAYCYFNTRQFDMAEPLFASIKGLANKYTSAGHYYYGLLAYNEGNYKEALQSFEKIQNEKQYQNIVPYYIAEIHYFSGDRKRALEDALRLIRRSEKSYYDKELHLLAAQVLFEDQRYGEALPYFEQYYNSVDKIRKEDLYEMGYSYYRVNEWKNAIEKFKPLSSANDSLGQTAMYLLGDCYLKTGDKGSARNAFSICADMPFNPPQKEASLVLSAKLSYEMGYNDDAMGYVSRLLAEFPSSQYTTEIKTLRSDLLVRTNNYAEAYTTLKSLSSRDAAYNRVFPKVAYGYAMQQMQEGNYAEAYDLLTQALEVPYSIALQASAYFWKAELAYKLGRFPEVISNAQQFLALEPGTRADIKRLSPKATTQNAYINMGYAAMEQKDFSLAQTYFNRAQQAQGDDAAFALNATLREADALFMQKEYGKASGLYDKIIAANTNDADYARFQKAIILGLQTKNNDKIALLETLINSTPPSAYANDARYELALVYIEQDKYQQAISLLEPLITGGDKRSIASKALMKTGFAYQQMGNDTKAIENYRHIVAEYPSSEERPAALDALKALYVTNNQPEAYAKLLSQYNLGAADDNSLDSTFYAAAETQYASGKWAAAKQSFGQYLQKYPNGAFAAKAHYYKAESHYKLKEYKEALADYEAVLQAPWSDFTENSARRAASIAFQNKEYTTALTYYSTLRGTAMAKENLQAAYDGMMQSSYSLSKFTETVSYADTLTSLPGIDENTLTNALFFKARSLQQLDKKDEALAIYLELRKTKLRAIAAEAYYRSAEIYMQQGKLKEAEEAASGTVKNAAGNDYWIVKSYILLADILTKQKDYFNAKATLQSIIKNTKIAELKQEATKKLDEVKALEKAQSKLSEE